MRSNEHAIVRLNRYFEDAVLKNNLSPFIVQGRCPQGAPEKEIARYRKLAGIARRFFIFTCDETCQSKKWEFPPLPNVTLLKSPLFHQVDKESFTIIMDPRFAALQASQQAKDAGNFEHGAVCNTVWTFEPNVVYSGLEYLMARTSALHPDLAAKFNEAVMAATPNVTSTQLTLAVTTKLAQLLQSQTEREMAVNHISSAIRSSLDLTSVLQTAVDEIGRTLNARRCVIMTWKAGDERFDNISEFLSRGAPSIKEQELCWTNNDLARKMSETMGPVVCDPNLMDDVERSPNASLLPSVAVPIIYDDKLAGILAVEDYSSDRIWDYDEIRLMETVADQLSVAINHAYLFHKVKELATTDGLTGLLNHRHFQERLQHEINISIRFDKPLSLILLDLDHLKRINDTYGHRAGDAAIKHIARAMLSVLRNIDVAARYGGEEFVAILPSTDIEGARTVGERLRQAISAEPVAEVGTVTASIGIATFPIHASTREELIEVADRAMYVAKNSGRNRVCTAEIESATLAEANL